jgi:hypothetical protein
MRERETIQQDMQSATSLQQLHMLQLEVLLDIREVQLERLSIAKEAGFTANDVREAITSFIGPYLEQMGGFLGMPLVAPLCEFCNQPLQIKEGGEIEPHSCETKEGSCNSNS